MIDKNGYRPSVGMVLINPQRKLLWARRKRQQAWQFPQGGIQEEETPEQALYRELEEEVGLKIVDVEIVSCTQNWLHYRIPEHYMCHTRKPLCIGQKQKWYLLRIQCSDENVCLDKTGKPEFDQWRWVSYWYPRHKIIDFKRDVYRAILKEFAPVVFSDNTSI